MIDKDTSLHAYVEDDDVKVEYKGDNPRHVILLINILLSTLAYDLGVTYDELIKDIAEGGTELDEFLREEIIPKTVAESNSNG